MPIPDVGPRIAVRTSADFDDRPYERFAVTPLSPTIGAEIGGVDLNADLDDELQSELHRALLEFKVLFFRSQNLTSAQQRTFAQRWGSLERHPFFTFVYPGQQEADIVRLAKDAEVGGAENEWHADVTWRPDPSWGAVLRAIEVPAIGGDTLWADTAAAHDALPEEVRERIATMTAMHDWRHTFGMAMTPEERAPYEEEFPPIEHPVVRVHPETGRRHLFVNRIFTTGIVGVEPAESDALLAQLTAEIARPEHQCRFHWEPGSVAWWDNRATQHYAVSDYWPQRRVMDRISIAGDRPFGPDQPHASASTEPEPAPV